MPYGRLASQLVYFRGIQNVFKACGFVFQQLRIACTSEGAGWLVALNVLLCFCSASKKARTKNFFFCCSAMLSILGIYNFQRKQTVTVGDQPQKVLAQTSLTKEEITQNYTTSKTDNRLGGKRAAGMAKNEIDSGCFSAFLFCFVGHFGVINSAQIDMKNLFFFAKTY